MRLREVAHEFGGRIPHGGGDRDSAAAAKGLDGSSALSCFFVWLDVLVRVAIVLLLCTFK